MVTNKILVLLISISALICASKDTTAENNNTNSVGNTIRPKISKRDLAVRLSDIKQKLQQLLSKAPTENVREAVTRLEKANVALVQALANNKLKKSLRDEANKYEEGAEDAPNIILNPQPLEVVQRLIQEVEPYFLPGRELDKETRKQTIYAANKLTDDNILDKGGETALSLAGEQNLKDALFLFKILAEKYMEQATQKRIEAKAKSRQEKDQELLASGILNALEVQYPKLKAAAGG